MRPAHRRRSGLDSRRGDERPVGKVAVKDVPRSCLAGSGSLEFSDGVEGLPDASSCCWTRWRSRIGNAWG